jgi:hypothetical protein
LATVSKSFEQLVPFRRIQTPSGEVRLPLISVTLVQPAGGRVSLPLLFDTGASTTTLRDDMHSLLGLPRWDVGPLVEVSTAGGQGKVAAHRYQARLELFGKSIDCPVNLQILPRNPLYLGLLGREVLFEGFGFGFWEGTGELFATTSP